MRRNVASRETLVASRKSQVARGMMSSIEFPHTHTHTLLGRLWLLCCSKYVATARVGTASSGYIFGGHGQPLAHLTQQVSIVVGEGMMHFEVVMIPHLCTATLRYTLFSRATHALPSLSDSPGSLPAAFDGPGRRLAARLGRHGSVTSLRKS